MLDFRILHGRLIIAGLVKRVGQVGYLCKSTEVDGWRRSQIEEAERRAGGRSCPAIVMHEEHDRMAVWDSPGEKRYVRRVMAWKAGQGSTNDMFWDYMPDLGYAVHLPSSDHPVLHVERAGRLYPVDFEMAVDQDILDPAGKLRRHSQPVIEDCLYIASPHPGFLSAKVVFEGGLTADVLTTVPSGVIPARDWYVGKSPASISRYELIVAT